MFPAHENITLFKPPPQCSNSLKSVNPWVVLAVVGILPQ